MKLNAQSHSLIEEILKEALGKFKDNGSEQIIISDIHILPKSGLGELIILDDDDNELSRTIIEEWIDYDKEDFYIQVERILCSKLNKLKKENYLNDLSLIMPYSFVLIDEEKETITELLLMDDDTLLMNDELLKGLDEELNEFLKKLLED